MVVNDVTPEPPLPGSMSSRSAVPAVVPSVVQGSVPCVSSVATKSVELPAFVKAVAAEPVG